MKNRSKKSFIEKEMDIATTEESVKTLIEYLESETLSTELSRCIFAMAYISISHVDDREMGQEAWNTLGTMQFMKNHLKHIKRIKFNEPRI